MDWAFLFVIMGLISLPILGMLAGAFMWWWMDSRRG